MSFYPRTDLTGKTKALTKTLNLHKPQNKIEPLFEKVHCLFPNNVFPKAIALSGMKVDKHSRALKSILQYINVIR